MKKFKLDIQYDYDFALIGICSTEKEHRICWLLNAKLGMELQKAENLCLKNTEINFAEFSMYAFTNSDECSEYYLLRNEGTRVKPSEINLSYQISIPTKEPLKEWLILEEKQCDYFLLLKSESSNTEKILSKLLEIPAVITAYSIDPTKLKSKQNLLF